MNGTTFRLLLASLLAILGLGATRAQTGLVSPETTLIAGPIVVGADQGRVSCELVNVSQIPVTLQVEGVLGDGSIAFSDHGTVAAGESLVGIQQTFTSLTTSHRPVYCRFTFAGNARQVRAAAVIRESASPFNVQVILKAD